MKKYRCTVDEVMSWDPCEEYTRERVKKLFGHRKYLTAAQILDLNIPIEDRFWAVLREELVPERVLHEFACKCAESALRRERRQGRELDVRILNAIRVKRLWLDGKVTDEDLSAAESAAELAAWSAAWSAAESAARSAAWSAARSAQRRILIKLLSDWMTAYTKHRNRR